MTTLSQAALAASMPAAPKFRVLKQVTRSLLKPVENVAVYVTVTSAIKEAPRDEEIKSVRKSKKAPAADAETESKAPPLVMDVTNLETGELQQMIVPAVLETEIKRHYDDDSYVGLSFILVRLAMVKKAGGHSYSRWSIQEIDPTPVEDETEKAPETAAEKPAKKAK